MAKKEKFEIKQILKKAKITKLVIGKNEILVFRVGSKDYIPSLEQMRELGDTLGNFLIQLKTKQKWLIVPFWVDLQKIKKSMASEQKAKK